MREPGPRPTSETAGEVAYHSLPDKPAGDPDRGREGVERTAIDLAAWLRAVPLAEDDLSPCPAERLEVAWSPPDGDRHHGAYVGPLGPAPAATTEAVNGVVVCEDAPWAYMGFQARWDGDRWDVVAVPVLDAEEHVEEVTAPEPAAPSGPAPSVNLDGRTFGVAIEGLAAYEPQRTCDATAKPGTAALRNLLLRDNPGSRNLGIVRGCGVGGTSEHKEGRAFDWGVNVHRPAEKAQAEAFVARILATDEHGNRFALARRMGVMYVIWNQQIWSAYRAADGWRPYHGASPHTDHVHISLSWAGAQARTSFWSGNVVDVLLASSPDGTRGSGGGSRQHIAGPRARPRPQADPATAAKRRAEWEAARAVRDEQRRAESAARRAADAERRAAADAERARRRAAYEAWKREQAEARAEAEEAAAARREAWARRQQELRDRRLATTTTTVARSTTTTVARSTTTTSTTVAGSTTTTSTVAPSTTTTSSTTSTTAAPSATTTTVDN